MIWNDWFLILNLLFSTSWDDYEIHFPSRLVIVVSRHWSPVIEQQQLMLENLKCSVPRSLCFRCNSLSQSFGMRRLNKRWFVMISSSKLFWHKCHFLSPSVSNGTVFSYESFLQTVCFFQTFSNQESSFFLHVNDRKIEGGRETGDGEKRTWKKEGERERELKTGSKEGGDRKTGESVQTQTRLSQHNTLHHFWSTGSLSLLLIQIEVRRRVRGEN